MPATKLPPPAPMTAPPPPPPRANGSSAVATTGFSTLPRRKVGKRLIIPGVEGVGKTSMCAFVEGAAGIMAGNETGYETLRDAGRVPDIPMIHTTDWNHLMAEVCALNAADTLPFSMLFLDAMSGIERMNHQYVCDTKFGGDWGEKGFTSFQKGYDVSVGPWLALLGELDLLAKRGVDIVILAHILVKPFKNPMGEDFDRYVVDCHHKTWGVTHKWADATLFLNFLTDVREKEPGKKKGIGGTTRIMYTERRDAFDAKNRYGLPEMITMPDDPAQMWATLEYYIEQGKVAK